jgi:hypothetical protein
MENWNIGKRIGKNRRKEKWWSLKKSANAFSRHSGESRNPVLLRNYKFSGLRFSPE